MTTPPRDPNRDLSGIQPMLPGEPVDEDMAEQAVPGHGIPSQDPAAGAQVGMTEAESEREAKSAYVGGGAMAGMATGAAVGALVGGPLGVLVGGTVGTIAGALGGEAAGSANEPDPDPLPPVASDRRVVDTEHPDGYVPPL